MKTNGNGCLRLVNGAVSGLTAAFRGALTGGHGGGVPNGDAESGRKIEQSISYMRQHLDQPLQVATLAAAANVSPSHYFMLFKRWTGYAPMSYFTYLRMQQAGRLLGETSLSVKEVAAALGYDDPFYFSRVFKAVHRVPPSRYRAARSVCRDHPIVAASRPPAFPKEALIPA